MSTIVETFLNLFDDKIEETPVLSNQDKETILSTVNAQTDLEEGFPLLLKRSNGYAEQIEKCDANIKMWQESKKFWKGRSAQFLGLLGELLVKLHVPAQTIKCGKNKLQTSTRSTLEVDEPWLLAQYQALADALQTRLPDYVKVSITIDKTKLSNHVKKDNTLLTEYPEKIHWKPSTSTTIK